MANVYRSFFLQLPNSICSGKQAEGGWPSFWQALAKENVASFESVGNAGHTHVNERIGAPLVVCLRAPGTLKTKMLIEPHRLSILFVHIGRKARLHAQRVLNERAPNPRSPLRWIDKQSLHMFTVEKHKADRMIPLVRGQPKRGLRQEGDNLRFNLLPVGRR